LGQTKPRRANFSASLSFAPQAGQLTSIAIRALQINRAPNASRAFTVWVIAAATGNRKKQRSGKRLDRAEADTLARMHRDTASIAEYAEMAGSDSPAGPQ
jgi:hypothetical protein